MNLSILEPINYLIHQNYNTFLLTIFLIPFLVIFFNKICENYKILDIPDGRKSHSFPMPISGGFVLVFSSVILLVLMNKLNLSDKIFFFDIILVSSIFFFLGLIDDLKKYNTKLKILSIALLIILILIIYKDFNIINLKFNFIFNKNFILEYLSKPFTMFCIFILFNTLNYADGKNGISISLSIFWISYLMFKTNIDFFFLIEMILILFILLIFNLRNKFFLGNSGVNFLSIFISLSLIKIYNTQSTDFYCDEIFLLLLVPGIDATRVTIYRIYKKISPLKPDKNHLHHHLEKYIDEKLIWLVFLLLTIAPIFILLISDNFIISIIIPLLIYFFLISSFWKKKRN